MKRFQNILTVSILLSILFAFGCSKSGVEAKLVGTWKMLDMTTDSAAPATFWIFYPDGRLVVINDPNCPDGDTAVGSYNVVIKSMFMRYVNVNRPHGVDGQYQIKLLKKKMLALTRVGWLDDRTYDHFLWREFTKE